MKSLEKPVEKPVEKPIQKIQTGYEEYTVDEPTKQPVEKPAEQPEGSDLNPKETPPMSTTQNDEYRNS